MSDVFRFEPADIAKALDIVQWRLGDNKLRLYYPTAIKLAGRMRVCGKEAIAQAGGNRKLWRDIIKYESAEIVEPLHPDYRRSGYLSNLRTEPKAHVEGELVVLTFDKLTAKLHCTDALIAQAMLMRAARNAKRWAGDSNRGFVLSALLTNATPEGPLRPAV